MKEKPIHLEIIEMAQYLWIHKSIIIKVMVLSMLLGIIIVFSLPKEYTVKVDLATESNSASTSSLGGMASLFGINNISMGGNEALNTGIYPDIIASTPFLLEVLSTPINHQNKKIELKEYLKNIDQPWWNSITSLPGYFATSIKNIFNKPKDQTKKSDKPIEESLSPENISGIAMMKNAILAEMQRKSNIFSISVTLQDPDVTAQIADSIATKLQEYVTRYRTKKAQNNYEYLKILYEQRKSEYYQAQQAYANSYDQNKNIVSRKVAINQERLKNDMELSYQIYSQVATQLEVAKAKIQEVMPVFTVIEPAITPTQPSAPNNRIIIAGCILIGFTISSLYILIRNGVFSIIKNIIHTLNNK